MDSWWAGLAELADKYRTLLTLCGEREALAQNGVLALTGFLRDERHGRTRELARRFPGALRELDGATTHGVATRLEAIETELSLRRDREAAPRWMRIVDDFHSELRIRLQLKGALARGEPLTPEEEATITDPPYGRLQELVWTLLAERHGLTPEELRGIVHGGKE